VQRREFTHGLDRRDDLVAYEHGRLQTWPSVDDAMADSFDFFYQASVLEQGESHTHCCGMVRADCRSLLIAAPRQGERERRIAADAV
jgi:hypothetical protein